MKIAFSADWHLYHRHLYGKNDTALDAGLARLAELKAKLFQMIKLARQAGAEFLVVAGDIFHQHIPNEASQMVLAEVLAFAIRQNLKVRMITGDHDTNGKIFSVGALAKLLESYSSEMLKIFLPTPKKVYLENVSLGDTTLACFYVPWQKHLHEVIKALGAHLRKQKKAKQYSLLVTHVDLSGIVMPSGHQMETTLTKEDLAPFDFAMLGNYHKAEVIAGRFAYAGSPMRMNWGERKEAKGFWIFDTDRKMPWNWVELPDLSMLEFDLSQEQIQRFIQGNYLPNSLKLKDAVVQIRLVGQKISELDLPLLARMYKDNGARQVIFRRQKTANEVLLPKLGIVVDAKKLWGKFCSKNQVSPEMLAYGLEKLT